MSKTNLIELDENEIYVKVIKEIGREMRYQINQLEALSWKQTSQYPYIGS